MNKRSRLKILFESASLLLYPATAARMIGGFASSFETKNASTSEAPSPSHSERATCAFILSSYSG
ncbi:hypothetical protein BLX04_15505 [Bacillus mycoides]|nr:hypothetical protein BLX04_15505 [Bacillus mycoides]